MFGVPPSGGLPHLRSESRLQAVFGIFVRGPAFRRSSASSLGVPPSGGLRHLCSESRLQAVFGIFARSSAFRRSLASSFGVRLQAVFGLLHSPFKIGLDPVQIAIAIDAIMPDRPDYWTLTPPHLASPRKRGEETNAVEERLATPSRLPNAELIPDCPDYWTHTPPHLASPRKRGEETNAVEERLATPSPHEMGRGLG